jgi:hypothetical protein
MSDNPQGMNQDDDRPAAQDEAADGAPGDGASEDRLRKKELKRRLDATRPLNSWERYRALTDALGEAYDLIDIGNREARFALILMGGLNAVLFVVATRTDLAASLTAGQRRWFGAALVLYAFLAIYFLMQAIELLRPRKFRPHLRPPGRQGDQEEFPLGIRYYEDVVLRDVDGHWAAWRDVHIGQLNAELAIQLHSFSLSNQAKHAEQPGEARRAAETLRGAEGDCPADGGLGGALRLLRVALGPGVSRVSRTERQRPRGERGSPRGSEKPRDREASSSC